MFNNQIINSVVEWERQLERENEMRNNRRGMPDYYPASQPVTKEHRSLLDRIFGPVKKEQPDYYCCAQEHRQRA